MADVHVIRLDLPYRQAFYDPETGLHLTLERPQVVIPADRPLSRNILRALRSGSLIDVYNTTNFRGDKPAQVPTAPTAQPAPEVTENQIAPEVHPVAPDIPANFPAELFGEDPAPAKPKSKGKGKNQPKE